jgi:hypothetical protein
MPPIGLRDGWPEWGGAKELARKLPPYCDAFREASTLRGPAPK